MPQSVLISGLCGLFLLKRFGILLFVLLKQVHMVRLQITITLYFLR